MLFKIKLAFGFHLKINIVMFACYVVKPKLMLDDGNNEMAACMRADAL